MFTGVGCQHPRICLKSTVQLCLCVLTPRGCVCHPSNSPFPTQIRYDLDLSTKPYKALRYHTYAVRGAVFHNSYPLFASSSDDGTAHVFHGRVYADLMTNPLIVPVKILRGHKVRVCGAAQGLIRGLLVGM